MEKRDAGSGRKEGAPDKCAHVLTRDLFRLHPFYTLGFQISVLFFFLYFGCTTQHGGS